MSFTLDKKFPARVYRAAYPRTLQHSREHKITELKGAKCTRGGYWKRVITETLQRTFKGKDTQSWSILHDCGEAIACSSYEDCWCNAQACRRVVYITFKEQSIITQQ